MIDLRSAMLGHSGFDAALEGIALEEAEDGRATLTLPVGPSSAAYTNALM